MAKTSYTPLSTRLSVTISLICTVLLTMIAIYVFVLKRAQAYDDNRHDVVVNLANAAFAANQLIAHTDPGSNDSEWLRQLLGEAIDIDSNPAIAEAFIIDKDGKCVMFKMRHDDTSDRHLQLTQTIISSLMTDVAPKVVIGHYGTINIESGGIEYQVFYEAINADLTLYYVSDFSRRSSQLSRSTRMLAAVFIILVVVIYFGLSYVIKRMIRPLTKFSDSAIEISKGNFDTDLPEVNTNDEMALLHDSFATMQRSIKQYTQELEQSTRQQAYIMGQLQVASRIQDDMLPKTFPPFPDRADIDIRAKLIPAKQIGGDLYNFFRRDNKIYFIIADVSGKSVPAALIMAIANNVFVTISPQCSDPADIMQELNVTTCANNAHSGYFITTLVGILDLNNGELKMCNAGHDPSLVIKADDTVEVLRLSPNLPVGVISGYKYTSVSLMLTEHTRIVMYTDGITEAENSEKQFFGLNSLCASVISGTDLSISSLIDKVISEVNQFATDTEKADDITIMVLDYKPSSIKMPSEVTIFNDIREIDKVRNFAQSVTTAMGTDENTAMKVNLALEEAVSNIIKYSFTESGNNLITMFASAQQDLVTIVISDTGRAFDPTLTDEADTAAPLEQRPIGGLGITLIRNICKEMSYLRQNNHNYLTLVFDLGNISRNNTLIL